MFVFVSVAVGVCMCGGASGKERGIDRQTDRKGGCERGVREGVKDRNKIPITKTNRLRKVLELRLDLNHKL